jgi:hypothetical protein
MFRHFYLINSSKSVGRLVSKLFPLLCRVYKKKSLHLMETVRKFSRDLIHCRQKPILEKSSIVEIGSVFEDSGFAE